MTRIPPRNNQPPLPRSRFCARSFSSEFLSLLLLAALALPSSADNLVPEGKRDVQVPFQGAGKMGMVYTPCFFPKDTEAVLFTCEIKTEGRTFTHSPTHTYTRVRTQRMSVK